MGGGGGGGVTLRAFTTRKLNNVLCRCRASKLSDVKSAYKALMKKWHPDKVCVRCVKGRCYSAELFHVCGSYGCVLRWMVVLTDLPLSATFFHSRRILTTWTRRCCARRNTTGHMTRLRLAKSQGSCFINDRRALSTSTSADYRMDEHFQLALAQTTA